VQEAAEHLGTTVDAIRKRVQRGTIAHDKDPDGRVWVLLDADMPRQDTDQDTAGRRQASGSEMVEELRDRIAYLEGQVEEEREARRRADTILAQLSAANAEQARTIRAIEAPASEDTATEVAEAVEEAPERATTTPPRSDAPGPQTAAQRPWWRRVFGR
jgi:hypothetical protein